MLVLAGFIASAASWAAFSDDWQAVLDMRPIPIKRFKMSEAAACDGEFRYWRKELRDERVNQLIAVIKRHVICGIGCVIPHDDFNEVLKAKKIHRSLNSPYFPALFALQGELIKFQTQFGIREQVDFIFDKQILTEDIREAHRVLRENVRPSHPAIIGESLIDRDDEKFLPLQAADLFAWKIRRYFVDKAAKRDVYWPWEDFEKSMVVLGKLYDRQGLELMYEYLKPPNGVSW